jgi:class 3 adenylate cyclase
VSPVDQLPGGTVTFLFTDIEGSTRLLKQLRERYGELLGEHQRILRETFAAHEGHEIGTQATRSSSRSGGRRTRPSRQAEGPGHARPLPIRKRASSRRSALNPAS